MKGIEKVVAEAKSVILNVGAFIANERVAFDQSRVETKGRNDMVSYVDKTAEQMLVSGLKEILPDSGFLTEEETIKQELKPYTWIIDPLDGTTNFVHNLPIYAISIGLLLEEELVAGMVYEINRKEFFSAIKGKGAWLNGNKIEVSHAQTMLESLVATGFPVKEFQYLDAYLSVLREIVQNSHGIRRGGSAAVDLAYVACGRYDAFFEYNLNSWDVAAGILIVQEAGGVVTDFSGGKDMLFGKQILAAGKNHTELLDLIRKHWPV